LLVLAAPIFLLYFFFAYCSSIGDFIQFQSAHVALSSGINPYIPEVTLKIQQNIFADSNKINIALMMWTLPWILPLLCPLGFSNITEYSILQWSIWGAFLVIASVYILFSDENSTLYSKHHKIFAFIAVCLGAPLLDAFKLHQSTPIFLLSLSLFYISLRHHKHLFCGLCMSIWIIKPHLFLLVVLNLLLNFRKLSSFAITIIGAIIGIITLLILSELNYPGGTMMWLDTLQFSEHYHDSTISRINWKGANLFGFLRDIFDSTHPILLILPSVIIWVLFIYLRVRTKLISDNILNLAWIIPLSILSAPYGWFYDYSLCLVSIFLTFKVASIANRLTLVVSLTLAYNILVGCYYLYAARMQHQMWWYPVGCLVIYLIATSQYPTSRRLKSIVISHVYEK
jgi:hypothetical protein